jgi:two-component system chemotaxis sensor kinase CheA
VDVGLLDKLMNLVGELVLARNQVLQYTSRCNESTFQATSQRLNLITTELQESVMKTRMQPIGNVWSKLPRVVRDLSASCGKQVRIEMEGKETELDKTIIEAIKDPLTHIVRNAVDHGIESPETRIARGKEAEGCLKMRAFHEGGQVNIEISDDGGGIDCARVRQKALDRGLITAEQAARLTDHEAFHLIFLPGFSTAEKVTNVSGRGVGMDVVKTNIEKIGGTVDLHSQLGEGTTLKIKIPLTLAIIPALIVTSCGDRFAIPQVSLLELVRLEAEQAAVQIELVHGAPVYRLRGQLLPLVYLNEQLKVESAEPPTGEEPVNIVVLQADGRPFGLVVNHINDTEEIVVKPLGKQLKGVPVFAGATIMGDGRVALILDVLGIAQQAGVVNETRNRSLGDPAPVRRGMDSRQTLLVFDAGQGSRMAIPLSMVARLEEFKRSSIEFSGAQEVVRYRGQILPLVRVARHVPVVREESVYDTEVMQVVVHTEQGRSVGLVVGKISDIVQETITVKRHAYGNGLFGSVVIQDQVTDLLDVRAVVRAADPSFYPAAPAAHAE